MGFGGISVGSLLLILLIVLVLFGTKKLRNIGTDLGGAIRGFKQALDEGQTEDHSRHDEEPPQIAQRESTQPQQRNSDARIRKEHSSS